MVIRHLSDTCKATPKVNQFSALANFSHTVTFTRLSKIYRFRKAFKVTVLFGLA